MTNAASDPTRLPAPLSAARRPHAWSGPLTWAIATMFAVIVAIALAVAAAAATLVAVLVAVAALVLRLAPRRQARGPVTLEGRRTPDGWDVEAATPR